MSALWDLTTVPIASPKKVLTTTVAVFKEAAPTPRVLGESEAFIAYTLKSRRAIRLICRANNERGAFRLHESPVHDLRFVNFHSNVAASASETDFYVWVALPESRGGGGGGGSAGSPEQSDAASPPPPPPPQLTVRPYFKITDKVTIHRFEFFINPVNSMPDLLVMYGKTAAVLESSKLINKYKASMLETTLSEASRELRPLPQEASLHSKCTTFTGGWLAFTAGPTKIMACTLRNTATPAWSGCEGEEVTQLSFVSRSASAAGAGGADGARGAAPAGGSDARTALLAVCSNAKVCLWKLTGTAEPMLLRTLLFGTVITMLTSRNALAIFNDAGRMARVQVRGNEDAESDFDATVYGMGSTVRPGSVCYHESSRFATLLVDTVMDLQLYQLDTSAAPTPTGAALMAATAPTAPAPCGTVLPFTDPSIITGTPLRLAPSSNTAVPAAAVVSVASAASSSANASPMPNSHSSTTAAAIHANPMAAVAAYNTARGALLNANLPQSLDGLVASALYQGDEGVRRTIEGLLNIIANITQILQLTPDQLNRDHQQLISLALEAQMTELQQRASTTVATPPAAPTPAPAAANSRHSEAFNSFALAKLLAPVANDIATGVTRGVRDTLRTELDAAVNAAFNTNARANQKDALRRRLEDALQEAPRVLGENAAKWIESYVERELGESLARMNSSMSALEEQNRKLQSALTQMMNSGVLQEVESMRAELAQLRAGIRSGEAIGASDGALAQMDGSAAPSPQTVIETAEKYIKEGHVSQGITYVVMAKDARCAVQLLNRLSEDEVATVAWDTEVKTTTWAKLVALLCTPEATETVNELEMVASFLFDVLSEHEDLVATRTATAQKLRSDIRHLVTRARTQLDSTEGRRILKDLEKSIQ